STASSYVLRGNGASIASSLDLSRSNVSSTIEQFFNTDWATFVTYCSCISRLSSCSTKAISGSIIQSSIKCLRVLDFSARNVGPNENTLPNAIAAASRFNCPLCERYASSSKYCVWNNSVVPSADDPVKMGGSIFT